MEQEGGRRAELYETCYRLVHLAATARWTCYPEPVTEQATALLADLCAVAAAHNIDPDQWGLDDGLPGWCLDRVVGTANRRKLGAMCDGS